MTQPAVVSFSDQLLPTIRPAEKDDWAYIMDSWKKSYHDQGADNRSVPGHIYWPNQHARIEDLRRNAAVSFRVAADPEDSSFIWGWACVEGETLHYVFVRASAQGQGVAKLLLVGMPRPLACTHWTKAAEAYSRKRPGVVLYEPSRRKK